MYQSNNLILLLNNQTNITNITTLGNLSRWGNQSTFGNTVSSTLEKNLTKETLFCQQERSNITLEDTLTRFIFIFIYATFGFCGIFINSYVVWVIKATQQWRTLTIRLILYLSIVDILCSLCNFLRLILFFKAKHVRYISDFIILILSIKHPSLINTPISRNWKEAFIRI